MSKGGGSSTARQRELWRLGVALADAGLDDRDAAVQEALTHLGQLLGVPGVGVWHTDLNARRTHLVHLWTEPDAPEALRDRTERQTNESVVTQMFANEGVAVLPIADLAAEAEVPEGWEEGIGLLAIVDWVGDTALTAGVLTPEPALRDDDVQFVRSFATTLRAFFARLRVEQDLQARLDLGDLVSRSIARLGTATTESADGIVSEVLGDLGAHLGLPTVRSYRVRPGRAELRHHAGDPVDPVWDRIPSEVEGLFPRVDRAPVVVPLAALAEALLGNADLVDLPGDWVVTLLAADAGAAWREILACIGPPRPWSVAENEAAAAVAHAVVQLDARLEAERWSNYRHAVQVEFSRIASRFLRATEHDADELIAESLGRVARQLDAPAAMMCDFPDDPGDGDDEAVGIVSAVWAEQELPFAIGSPMFFPQRWTPAHTGGARTGVFPISDRLDPAFRSLVDDDQNRFSIVSVPVLGTDGGRASLGLALPGSHRSRFPMLTELLTTFADLISQLRVRLALEADKRERQVTERFLHDVAVTLAETTDDDFGSAVDEVLAAAGRFLELDTLRVLHFDLADETYTVRYGWGGPDDVGTRIAFGVDELIDRAREVGDTVTRHDRLAPTRVASSVALCRRGSGQASVMVARRAAAVPLSPVCCQVLDEVNRLLGQVEIRIDAERYSKTAFGDSPIGIVLTDAQWRIVTCNPAFAEFVGYDSPGDLVGIGPDELLDTKERPPMGGTHEVPLRRRDGQRVWAVSHSTAIEVVVSGDPMWLIHVQDITERRRAEQLLRFQATHDELTGLANRRLLHQLCEERLDGAGSTAVLLLDLDRFKLVNDSLGHDRGDELLIGISDRLRLAVRPSDVVARLGGDEFALLLGGPVGHYEAGVVAARLLRLLGEPVALGSQTLYPSASIGIAIADDESTVSELLRRADTAMYRAKAAGRSRYEIFDEDLRGEVQSRMEIEAGLRRALRADELVVHYQPEVSLRTGEIVGVEALVRWNHPDDGLLLPGAFIDVAEETGLIIDIGTHVLFEACRSAVTWPGDDLVVRVNFAAAQLQRTETVGLVRVALERTGLAPRRLCVEITESAMMGDVHRAEQILRDLKELGVKIAVDDFGTGFSSLAYLKRFPVDALKIDRAFVSGLTRAEEDTAFVRSIVSLADALGLSVVAEGVETADQADVLLRLGCTRAQGFHFARPAPEAELLTRLGDQLTA